MIPVRVRGKKYRQKPAKSRMPQMDGSTHQVLKGQHKRAASTVLPTSIPQKTARLDRDASAKETLFAASPLECLPTEILEMIFLYSLNLSLPRASPVLGKRLASKHMKTDLLLVVFPSEGPEQRPQLRHIDYLLGVLGTDECIGTLQSGILALKWATPAFVRELTEPFMVRTIAYAFRKYGLGWLDESRKVKAEGAIKGTPDDLLDKGVLDVTKEANIDVVSRFYKRTVTGGKFKEAFFRNTDYMNWLWKAESPKRSIYMNIGFREGQITLRGLDIGKPHWKNFLDFQSKLICCAANFWIPAKLLHGPWSDDKCTELLRISRGGGRIDQTGSTMDEEVADTGFREAIIEGNQKAIVALIGSITLYRVANSVTGDNDCDTCADLALPPVQTHGTSMQIHGAHCERHIHRFCVGLTVRTEHVKLALNEDCSYRVLYTLLHALKIDVDWADTELTVWAIQKKKEDDERGQWLLDRLASLNIARYEEDHRNNVLNETDDEE